MNFLDRVTSSYNKAQKIRRLKKGDTAFLIFPADLGSDPTDLGTDFQIKTVEKFFNGVKVTESTRFVLNAAVIQQPTQDIPMGEIIPLSIPFGVGGELDKFRAAFVYANSSDEELRARLVEEFGDLGFTTKLELSGFVDGTLVLGSVVSVSRRGDGLNTKYSISVAPAADYESVKNIGIPRGYTPPEYDLATVVKAAAASREQYIKKLQSEARGEGDNNSPDLDVSNAAEIPF